MSDDITLEAVKATFPDRVQNEVIYAEQLVDHGDWRQIRETRPSIDIRIDSEVRVCVHWLDQGTLVTLEIVNCGVALPGVRTMQMLRIIVAALIGCRTRPFETEEKP